LDLVIQLDTIRLRRVTRGELAFYKAQAVSAYAAAFQQAGLGTVDSPPQRMAALINSSAVREALVPALLDWAVCAADKAQGGCLGGGGRQLRAPPARGRGRGLVPAAGGDPQAWAEWAGTADVGSQSVSVLLALGERLRSVRKDAVPFLKRVQQEHPDD